MTAAFFYHNAHLQDREHFVYVMWHRDEPLYVGMTYNPGRRLSTWGVFGKCSRPWLRAVTHVDVWAVGPGRAAAARIEAETIRALDPAHNIENSPRAETLVAASA